MQNKSRMKIWVCEYVSAGGLASESLPASLLQEGLLMRDALLADLSTLDVDCITSHDVRVTPPSNAFSQVIQREDDVMAIWRKQLAADDIDACWIISPETDGMLERMHHLVEESGKRWIGCSVDAIRKTTSKSLMTDICQLAGISIIPYVYLNQSMPLQSLPWYQRAHAGWVVKPDDGAGCDFVINFKSDSEVIEFYNKKIKSSILHDKLLLQPYIAGNPLSMSVLSTKGQVKVIACHQQKISIENGRFRFQGADVNAAVEYFPLMQTMAEHIHKAIPGLVGYWGADVILSEGDQLILVEINPRLTTPYIGLSRLLSESPAKNILEAILKNRLTAVEAKSSVSLVLPSVDVECSLGATAGSDESLRYE